MSNINQIVLYEFTDHPLTKKALKVGKQAAVWGIGGGLGYLANKDRDIKKHNLRYAKQINPQNKKHVTKKDKDKNRKFLLKSITTGGLTGAAGALV